MAIRARAHRAEKRAHASRSASDRLSTSARHVNGASLVPSSEGPYATTERSRSPNTLRRSATRVDAAASELKSSDHSRLLGRLGG